MRTVTLSRRIPGAHWRPHPLVFTTDTETHQRLLTALRRRLRHEQRTAARADATRSFVVPYQLRESAREHSE
ncbi:hypothetical protein ACFRMN_32340 [Streptomyces sp. NPDC056835]|uniref:hypothetical protein n=1 Tax=Streptomyces sp. NPDC056835 TaxID=3345956 RepID=UPI00368E7A93